jgi:hypothetical protein
MDHSLLTASRTTHVKIVVVALLGAILVVTVGIASHLGATGSSAVAPGVVKAGEPAAYSNRDGALVR